jgi:DNA-binding transcriptional regulator YhcF (GntR family)
MESAILHFEDSTMQLDPPLYLQLRAELCRHILDHSLLPGTKPPSTRALAKKLAISRNTVVNAYKTLAAEGLVTGAIGSGTRVAITIRRPRKLDLQRLLQESHFPNDPVTMSHPDGNPLLILRS